MNTKEFGNNFIAGGVALATAFAVMHPLDTLKTRMQASMGSTGYNALFSRETLRILGKGFTASVVGAAPQGGARLATYELTKSTLHGFDLGLSPIAVSSFSAIIGDFASSVVKVPREVITSRLQTDHYKSQGNPTMFAIRSVLQESGVGGLFRGFWSTTLRDCPFMVILFTTYESLKLYNAEHHDVISTTRSTLYGGLSGGLAGFLTTPMDVIKTRVMTQNTTGDASKMSHVFKEIVLHGKANNGVMRAIFVGGVPRSFWWFCVCSMFFPIYERTKDYLAD